MTEALRSRTTKTHHNGTLGDEMADKLAKEALNLSQLEGPSPRIIKSVVPGIKLSKALIYKTLIKF